MGNVNAFPHTGRLMVLTEEWQDLLVEYTLDNPFCSAREVREEFELDVTEQTIRNVWRRAGLSSHPPVLKPLLTEEHKRVRRCWIRKMLDWDEEWSHVAYLDEKVFKNVVLRSGKQHVWRLPRTRFEEQNIAQRSRGRIALALAGWIHNDGVGTLTATSSGMNGVEYCHLQKNVTYPSIRQIMGIPDQRESVYLVQDNSTPHTSLVVKQWMRTQRDIKVLLWPSISPDFNPIENVWGLMIRDWPSNVPRNEGAMYGYCLPKWNHMGQNQQLFNNLVGSMRQRLQQSLENNGGQIKY